MAEGEESTPLISTRTQWCVPTHTPAQKTDMYFYRHDSSHCNSGPGERLRQRRNCQKFEASLSFIVRSRSVQDSVRPCLNKAKTNKVSSTTTVQLRGAAGHSAQSSLRSLQRGREDGLGSSERHSYLYKLVLPGRTLALLELMAQQVKVPVTRPDDLRSIPRTHMVEGRENFHKLSFGVYMCVMACPYVHAYTYKYTFL